MGKLNSFRLEEKGLKHLEDDLDELLELLVSHHETGLAHKELKLQFKFTNLSWACDKKWRGRCEGLTTRSRSFYVCCI